MISLLLMLADYGISLGSLVAYGVLYERKKKRLGYVNLKKNIMFNTFFSCTREAFQYWFTTICPIVNLAWLAIILTFKKRSDEDLSREYNDGDVVSIDAARSMLELNEEGNNELALKVLKVRKAQMQYEIYLSKKKHEYDEIMKQIESTYHDLSLPEKVVAVRKLQSKSNMVNRVTPFSEYGPDEKIAMLLAELEIAYKEKAEIEGTDLDKEVKLLLDNKD